MREVVPILEWTQVSTALEDFVTLCLNRGCLLDFSGLGFTSHYDRVDMFSKLMVCWR